MIALTHCELLYMHSFACLLNNLSFSIDAFMAISLFNWHLLKQNMLHHTPPNV